MDARAQIGPVKRKKPAKLLVYKALTLIKGASRFGPVFFSLRIKSLLGSYHPVAITLPDNCRLCRDKLSVGLELYGGLGSTEQFGFKDTAHYLAPVLVWNLGKSQAIKISPGFGLTGGSDRMLLRFGYAYEINGFGRKVAGLFNNH